jgi:hypothetical protein
MQYITQNYLADKNATAESTQPLKTLMIQLINSECDPNLLDDDGLTPSDIALSPVAWVIWCEVVQAAGLDVLSVLERDDELQGIILPQAYMEEKYRRVLRAPSPSWNDQSIQSDSPQEKGELCRYCEITGHHLVRLSIEQALTWSIWATRWPTHTFLFEYKGESQSILISIEGQALLFSSLSLAPPAARR